MNDDMLNKVRYGFAKMHGLLVSEVIDDKTMIIHKPEANHHAIIELRRAIGKPLTLKSVSEEEFNQLLSKHYEAKSGVAVELAENISEKMDLKRLMHDLPNTSDILESENSAPIISMINALFSEAVKQNASDIHIEIFEINMTVRFRIDGVLQTIVDLPPVLGPLIVSRIKVMSGLNIAEKRVPQDGRISIKVAGISVDVRVSTIPASHGERIVMRLLNKKSMHLTLEELGMKDKLLTLANQMIARPHGIVLVTGPTGSGKTTSLYAMLTKLNVPGRNILTVEDPIEYDLPGIGQMQVNLKADMTFARGLRAILRQDPNVIMVGEIRDLETAAIAVQASLTGHLVLSTLHTNTAIGAITRLRDMGIEPFLISSSLIGVIAQRLVRVLCQHCKKPYTASKNECGFLRVPETQPPTLYESQGCEHCNNTGFSGRIGIYEIIMLDSTLKSLIHDDASELKMLSSLRTHYESIRQDGIERALAGEITIAELVRVTSEE